MKVMPEVVGQSDPSRVPSMKVTSKLAMTFGGDAA